MSSSGWLRLIHSWPYQGQRWLAEISPVLGAGLGGLVLASASIAEPQSGWAVRAGVVLTWGLGGWFGSRLKIFAGLVQRRRARGRQAPSWSLAMATASLPTMSLLLMCSDEPGAMLLARMALAINLGYVGAKVHCRVLRCCEANRRCVLRNCLIRSGLLLQEGQLLMTIIIVSCMSYLWWQGIEVLCASVGFAGHGVLRTADWHLRSRTSTWRHDLCQPGSGGCIAMGIVMLIT